MWFPKFLLLIAALIASSEGTVTGSCDGEYDDHRDYGTIQMWTDQTNQVCSFTITVSPGKYVELQFTHLDMPDSIDCSTDSIVVSDIDLDSAMLGQFCGNRLPFRLVASSNRMHVSFFKNEVDSRRGFTATYRALTTFPEGKTKYMVTHDNMALYKVRTKGLMTKNNVQNTCEMVEMEYQQRPDEAFLFLEDISQTACGHNCYQQGCPLLDGTFVYSNNAPRAYGVDHGKIGVFGGDVFSCKYALCAVDETNGVVCLNEGTLRSEDSGGCGSRCVCAEGFTGERCEIDLTDDCQDSPCGDHGTCADHGEFYTCQCDPNWTGGHCEEEIDLCRANSNDHGTCTSCLDGRYSCTCNPGWTGESCETDLTDDCQGSTCNNGGTCTDHGDFYTCQCDDNWTGQHCEIEKDLCRANSNDHGTCTSCLDGRYSCTCNPGWTGESCETDLTDDCQGSTCNNGGTCTDHGDFYTCQCDDNWTGQHCEEEIDLCRTNSNDHGTCTSCLDGRYSCSCNPGWTGVSCETDLTDDCQDSTCNNGGTCTDHGDFYTCQCDPNWTGQHCELEKDLCRANSNEHGTCTSCLDGRYSCSCNPGWTGESCETGIDECAGCPCAHGTCTDGENSFSCSCEDGWTGDTCAEQEIDDCQDSECNTEHGECVDVGTGYYCTCDTGFTGRNCETNIDDCVSSLCENGYCEDGVNSYTCSCQPGWEGQFCNEDINDCDPNPCQNGGTCTDGVNSYSCDCKSRFTGQDCQTDRNYCEEYTSCPFSCRDSPFGAFCKVPPEDKAKRPYCDSFECKKGWTCLSSDVTPGFMCIPPPK